MKKNGLELEIWEFRLWARVSYRWVCTGAGDNMEGWRELTQRGQAGSLCYKPLPGCPFP